MSTPGSFNFRQQQLTPWQHNNDHGTTLFTPSTHHHSHNKKVNNIKQTQGMTRRTAWRTSRHWAKHDTDLVTSSNSHSQRKTSTICDSQYQSQTRKRVNTLNSIDVTLEPAIVNAKRRQYKKKFILNFFKKQRDNTNTRIKIVLPTSCSLQSAEHPETNKYMPSHNSIPLSTCSQPLWKRLVKSKQKYENRQRHTDNIHSEMQNKSMVQINKQTPTKRRSFSIFI